MGFSFDASGLISGLNDFSARAEMGVKMFAETAAKKLEGTAKKEAIWEDRTGAARNRLTGYTETHPSKIRVILAHGVDYGIWLELANEKRFAILRPTIELGSFEIFRGLDKLFNRIGTASSQYSPGAFEYSD